MAVVMRLCRGAVILVVLYICLCLLLLPYLEWQPLPRDWDQGTEDVLADFYHSQTCPVDSEQVSSGSCSTSDGKFFFGLATAPAHVEDKLNDSWLEFAQGRDGKYPVRAWQNVPIPEERLRFWSEPDIELDLSKEAGMTVFRLGIDWGRIVTSEPVDGMNQVVDRDAIQHYQLILKKVKERNMRVMLTLFHHSLPKWALAYGGWIEDRSIGYFRDFTQLAHEEFGAYVDYWITFNEPHIFAILTHCSGTWPPGEKLSTLGSLLCFTPYGQFGRAMHGISLAHKAAYDVLHKGNSNSVVGVAHHVGVIRPYGLLDVPIVIISRWLTEFDWIDSIQNHLDFCGINYYGQEILSAAGLMLVKDEEYSEAGRGVYPDGLFQVLVGFHQRYQKRQPNLRYIVTENGFADARDIVRRPYLVEHLLAVHAAIKKGVPLDGYLQWTISDNWEWADGYCPKFGLVAVDRTDNLTRHPRPSYYMYKKIATTGIISRQQREKEWSTLQAEVRTGGTRPFCRVSDSHKRMWAESLDRPTNRLIADRDWRFTHYKTTGVLELSRRSAEVVGILAQDILNYIAGRKPHVILPPELVTGEF